MYFAMLFQILFTFPLQVKYKIGPQLIGIDGFDGGPRKGKYQNYRKKGFIFCLVLLPYQIAFL